MIYSAFILGLAGSVHCLGMCGPLAFIIQSKNKAILQRTLLYNIGRVLTYTALGLVFGIIGRTLNIVSSQNTLFLIIGSILLVSSTFPNKLKNKLFSSSLSTKYLNRLKSKIALLLASEKMLVAFTFGILNGLIPCGLVYFALIAATAMPSIWESTLYMSFFGLGTVPMMLFSAPIGRIMKQMFGNFINFKPSFAIAFVGVLFILKGLALGIPYLSPEVDIKNGSNCHKNTTECQSFDSQNTSK